MNSFSSIGSFSASIAQRLESIIATDSRTIGLFGSFVLVTNNITVTLPVRSPVMRTANDNY